MALRQAIDEVLDGMRTGRYDVDQLEKTEKTFLGTKVEMVLRHELERAPGRVLDTTIAGQEVDIKFSLRPYGHMIPREAVGRLCLLFWADDRRSVFSAGIVRAEPDHLNRPNQDGKRTIKREARCHIRWLVREPENGLPVNLLLSLPQDVRDAILRLPTGQAGVNELFRRVRHRIIPRSAVVTVARQHDGPKRARDARKCLERENIRILCGDRLADRTFARQRGLPVPSRGEFMSVDLSPPSGA